MKDDDGRMDSAVIAILVCRVYSYGRFWGDLGFVVLLFIERLFFTFN